MLNSFLLISMCIFGCGSADSSTTSSAKTIPSLPKGNVNFSEDEAIEFAKQVEIAVTNGNYNKCSELFHYDLFLDQATEGLNLSKKSKNGFRKVFISSSPFVKDSFLIKEIIEKCQGTGFIKFLRIRKKENGYHALFRIILDNDGGVDYLDLLLYKDYGHVRAIA